MPNIPLTHNRPVNPQQLVRRGSKVTPSETTGDRTQRTQTRNERRRQHERRRKQVAVRFERRNKGLNRRQGGDSHQAEATRGEAIGRYINTQV